MSLSKFVKTSKGNIYRKVDWKDINKKPKISNLEQWKQYTKEKQNGNNSSNKFNK